MEDLIILVKDNPLYLVIGSAAVLIIIVAIIKKFTKTVILLILFLAGYTSYLVYTKQKIPINQEELIRHTKEQLEKIKK